VRRRTSALKYSCRPEGTIDKIAHARPGMRVRFSEFALCGAVAGSLAPLAWSRLIKIREERAPGRGLPPTNTPGVIVFCEKPRPSAGLILVGLISLLATYLLRWIGQAMDAPAAGGIAFIFAAVGVVCLIVGLWRFLYAFDSVALHRWQTTIAAKNEEVEKLAAERQVRAKDNANP